jgi:hypothetical protein
LALGLCCAVARSQDLVISGVTDRTVYTDRVVFRVPALDGFRYDVRLDGTLSETDADVVVTTVDYHELRVARTALTTGTTTNLLVRFIVRSSARGNTEWGLPPWTPYPDVPSSPAELAGAGIRLLAPTTYWAGLELPLVAWVEDSAGRAVRVNGLLGAPGLAPMAIRRGVGCGLLPAPSGQATQLQYSLQMAGLSVLHQVAVSTNLVWTPAPGGTLASDTQWPPLTTIDLTNNLTIPPGVTLTVGAGTLLRLAPAVELHVQGRLHLEGARDQPVVFLPADATRTWGGIITTSSAPAEIVAAGALFVGSGAHATWFEQNEGYSVHRQEQALLLLDGARATLTDCAFFDGHGQFGHGRDAELTMTRCVVQRFITGGEYVGGRVTLTACAFLEFPVDSPAFDDADNDGLYLTEGTHLVRDSLIGWAKDDAIDSGSGGAGSVLVTNCWIESAFHEGLAWSGEGRVTQTYDTVILNCGQGIESGWSTGSNSPDVFADHLLSLGNLSGARFGDNYDWTYHGRLRLTNSFLLYNYRDVFGLNWDDWTYRTNQIDLRGNRLTAPDPAQPENLLWDPAADGAKLAPFLTTPPGAAVGLALLNQDRQLPFSAVSDGILVGLSCFRPQPVSVTFALAGAKGELATGTLVFQPGETVKRLRLTNVDLASEELVRLRLHDPTNASFTGPTELYFHNDAGVTHRVLVPPGASWRYLDTGENAGTNWFTLEFEDLPWLTGQAELGYGEQDETTPVRSTRTDGSRIMTTYFRHAFLVADPAAHGTLELRLKRDDGGIVYLNGVEVFRSNITTGAVDYLTPASNAGDDGKQFFSTRIAPGSLRAGTNVVAVEIHQDSLTSSDISFDLELVATPAATPDRLAWKQVGGDTVLYWPDPAWQLESAPTIDGPWSSLADEPSPMPLRAADQAQFYRLARSGGP